MKKFKADKQVSANKYINLSNINMINMYNLYYAIRDINQILPNGGEVLHVGVGTDLLSPILKSFGYKVYTMDILDELKPDYVGSLHDLDKVVDNKHFDLIICSHVLEHMPFDLFEEVLKQISIHSKYSLIYLPNAGIALGAELRLHPKYRKTFRWFFPIFKNRVKEFDGEHYWELEMKSTSINIIREKLKKYFIIKQEYRNEYWDNSYNFSLKSIK